MEQSETALALRSIFPKERIRSELIDLVAYASDAGFYYLRPKAVVLPVSEEEITRLFSFSKKHKIPLVFRAAGTSLSGQAVTDGILVDLSQHWDKIRVEDDGAKVRVGPGAIGATVNTCLRKYGRKIGPDPASINAAMMGGIISNNSSGMCCGVAKNAYHTTKYIRFILPGGETFSTEIPADYERFRTECPELFTALGNLREQIIADTETYSRIRKKYRTKNTVGYAVNSFIDYTEPLDILAHLLIGAEGTLGFIAEAVLETIPDFPAKSTAMLFFPDIYSACRAIVPLTDSGAAAVELMDRASLRSIEHINGIPAIIKQLSETAAALLIEYQGNSQAELQTQINSFLAIAPSLSMVNEAVFTSVPQEQALLWKVRKGMFPSVGAVRASGTSVILEDIAFPVDQLGDAIMDLQQLFNKHGYPDAIIFGHAKDGNIHFVVTQAFDTALEIDRYNRFLQDVVNLVVKKYDGALKAEHGTGRNMAPFVETEWGSEIYGIMKAVKTLVDPANFVNPGVIINADKNAHITHLKELPKVEEEVDRCMECGFCEHKCPSRNITLTPRKRIVVRRELLNLKKKGSKKEYKALLQQYQYQGLDTCAVDGLCATVCPVDINTGDLVKRLRRENHSGFSNAVALFTAKNFGFVSAVVKLALTSGIFVNKIFGSASMNRLTKMFRKIMPSFPLWSQQLSVAKAIPASVSASGAAESVVYFPTCISRVMGDTEKGEKGIMQTFMDVSAKAGISVVVPRNIIKNCCGQIYSSKGFKDALVYSTNETVQLLWEATVGGKHPVVLDISSCTQTLVHNRNILSEENKVKFDSIRIIDSIEYIHDYILPRINVVKKKDTIALHPVCSLQKMPGLESMFSAIAAHFSDKVTVPVFAGCCGMAGDRGFLHPELTLSATRPEAAEVQSAEFSGYYSSSKTCEIALSEAVGKNYRSILHLVDETTSL